MLVEGLLDPERDLAPLRAGIASLSALAWRRAVEDRALPAATVPPDDPDARLLALEEVDHGYVAKVYDLVNSHPCVHHLMAHAPLQRVVDVLLNGRPCGELVVNGSQLRMDLPGNESELLGWHTDHAYFSAFPVEGCVAWIPLGDVAPGTGGISLVPHRFEPRRGP